MRRRAFGRTGMAVSEYGLGTWAMGGGIYGMVDDEESIRTIHRAGELGINFLDTAPMYGIEERRDGRAERVIGKALKGARRADWVIATKFGRHLNGNERWTDMDEDFSGARAARSVEESLRRLDTDYIDILFVHSPPAAKFDPEDAFKAMLKLKEQGKIRAVGFSFWESVADTLPQVLPFLRKGICEAVQFKLSLLIDEAVEMLLPIAREAGTALVAREALANGVLTDDFHPGKKFDPTDIKAVFGREQLEAKHARANQFRFLVQPTLGIGKLEEAALHWVVSHPEVSTVIPGSKNVAELEACVAAADSPYYDQDVLAAVREIQKGWTG